MTRQNRAKIRKKCFASADPCAIISKIAVFRLQKDRKGEMPYEACKDIEHQKITEHH
jgi:hypothetical protein